MDMLKKILTPWSCKEWTHLSKYRINDLLRGRIDCIVNRFRRAVTPIYAYYCSSDMHQIPWSIQSMSKKIAKYMFRFPNEPMCNTLVIRADKPRHQIIIIRCNEVVPRCDADIFVKYFLEICSRVLYADATSRDLECVAFKLRHFQGCFLTHSTEDFYMSIYFF